jgi:hypothetical protein
MGRSNEGPQANEGAQVTGIIDRALAYAYTTSDRAKLLDIYARQLADKKYVPSFIGGMMPGRDAGGEFVRLQAKGFWGDFRIRPHDGANGLPTEAAAFLELFADAATNQRIEMLQVEVKARLKGLEGELAPDGYLRIISH